MIIGSVIVFVVYIMFLEGLDIGIIEGLLIFVFVIGIRFIDFF